MNDEDIAALRDGTTQIVLEAGALAMEGFRSAALTRDKGGGGDLVTEFDERCEALLRARLATLLDGAAFVGEEGGGDPGDGLAWYVDPIDGTGNYAHGHPWFAVSVGLWCADEPLVGVVHAPALGLTYAAGEGLGATRNDQPIHVSSTDALERALLATGFAHDRATRPDKNYPAFVHLDASTHGVRRCAAAALELAVVADGGYDGFWDTTLAPWDVAAAVVLVNEAGGKVTRLDGGPFALTPTLEIVATNTRLHRPLTDALAQVRATTA